MIKLTEDDFTSGAYSNNEFRYHIKKGFTKEEKQQILDDYEKARKYEEDEERDVVTPNQNQKLRELIENKIEDDRVNDDEFFKAEFQKLLEESKNG